MRQVMDDERLDANTDVRLVIGATRPKSGSFTSRTHVTKNPMLCRE